MSFSAKYDIAGGVRHVSDYLGIDPLPILSGTGVFEEDGESIEDIVRSGEIDDDAPEGDED